MSKKHTAMVCGKMCTAPNGDYFVTCSFDANHVVLRSRLPYHIAKCIKNHPGHNKTQCPYDSTEYIDGDQFASHLLTCESRRTTYEDKFQTAELVAKGICNVRQTPFFHASAPVVDEDWGGVPPMEDLDEETINPPLGRGISRVKNVPKKGIGRAEWLDRIFRDYQKKKSLSGSSASSSSDKDNVMRRNIDEGQFDDQ